ncbi:MAG: PAS domain S-box protein [Pseudomonadota bacterium]
MNDDGLVILAIDDHQDNLTTLEAVVSDILPGARVVTAQDGWRGLELARSQDPDVVLLDIVMPGLDGFEVCRRLKNDEGLRHIPVVFLTALKTGRESRIQALEVGGEGFLAKPLDETELTAQIHAMAKIKKANVQKRQEKEALSALVAQRTRALERELASRRQAEEGLLQANRELEQSQQATLSLLEDLTQEVQARRQSQAALKESEEKYRGIFETIQDVYFEISLEGTILELSPSVERLSHYLRRDLLGASVWPLYASHRQRETLMAKLLKHSRINDFEINFADKDGRVVPCSISAMMVASQDGESWKVCGVLRDISQRKLDEEALKASETRLRGIFEQAAVGMSLLTPQGVWLKVNQRLCDILGYPREELFKLTFRDITHPEHLEQDLARVQGMAEGASGGGSWEKRYIRKDGRVIWVRLTTAMIKGQDGRPQYFVTVTEDITERKQAEDELKKSQAFSEGIIASSADCINVLDLEGRLRYMSPGGLALMGLKDLSPYLGQPYDQLWDQADQEKALHAMALARRGQRGTFQGLCPTADGRPRWWDVTVTPIVAGPDRVDGILAVSRDITERRQAAEEKAALEAQLRQAQKMEAIGTLAGGIAHDFNNILAAVLGFAEMARDDALAGRVNPADLEQIMVSAQRAKALVQQILAFSRKKEPDLKPLSLNQVVQRTRDILARTLPKMIHIDLGLCQEAPLVMADPTQLEQVLLNLAANARDAMPEGGRLLLETCQTVLDRQYCLRHLEVRPGPYALLTVSDTGQGIEQQVLEHVFEPFFTTKDIGKGTGLGLSSAYGIVKNHGGHIHCHSEPGRGTVFKIYLPLLQERNAPAPPEQQAARESALGRGERILLVDDEEALRQFGARALKGKGYQVRTAASGEEALEAFRQQAGQLDLVIMDLGMPGMGGHKALKEMLALDPAAKIVIASGYTAGGQVKESLESGAAGYVAKPFRLGELLSTVRKVLDGDGVPAAGQ